MNNDAGRCDDATRSEIISRVFDSIIDDLKPVFPHHTTGWPEVRAKMDKFCTDNSKLSPEELEELAGKLSPGGAHDAGLLIRYVLESLPYPDPVLTAACVYHNWSGGKRGFQFLPLPGSVDLDDYCMRVEELCERLSASQYDDTPLNILVGEDRSFYNSLPERFSVYRGGSHCTAEELAAGVCWSTSRAYAEWFANRYADDDDHPPLLITARVSKSWVMLTNASEFEVATRVQKWRQLKCAPRKRMVRPRGWGEEA